MKDYLAQIIESQDLKSYLGLVREFVIDSNHSPNNSADLEIFDTLIFHTKFGKNHIYFYTDLLEKLSYENHIELLKVFSKYLQYLDGLSLALLLDALDYFFEFIAKQNQTLAVSAGDYIFVSLPDNIKEIIMNYNSEFINTLPKIKLYRTFY